MGWVERLAAGVRGRLLAVTVGWLAALPLVERGGPLAGCACVGDAGPGLDLAQHYLVKYNITGMRRVRKSDNLRIAR